MQEWDDRTAVTVEQILAEAAAEQERAAAQARADAERATRGRG